MEQHLLLEKLAAAERELSEADRALEKTLSELDVSPRAEKKTVTKVVETALERLRTARTVLTELERLLASG